MCYNWLVAGDGGGISNPRLDILIENVLMLARTSKKYFTFALVLGGLALELRSTPGYDRICTYFGRFRTGA